MRLLCTLVLTYALHIAFAETNTNGWIIFKPNNNFSKSEIDVSALLDKPAGKHGFLQTNNSKLQFEDGTAIKFWGVNICSDMPFSEAPVVDQWVKYLSKYGVNGVRFHKFTWHGYENEPTASDIKASKYPKFDYFSSELKKAGIYYSWSHIYGHRPGPADSLKMLAYNEIAAAGNAHLKGSTIGLVNFAPDLQALSIELTTNMLNHKNPITGLRYADDAALAYIELQNEDNIFFYTTSIWVEQCPTYKKLFCQQFSDWLKQKYGSQQKLAEAWGANAFNVWNECPVNENMDSRNIFPQSNLWFYTNEGLNKVDKAILKRLYDTDRFLYETQVAFYQKFTNAIRATGYKGQIIGSCWQAGDNISHYYNLHSDYLTGMVDRHNYFGGGAGGHGLTIGGVNDNNTAMVSNPGSGLLGTGMQMAVDRPFNLSEWMSLTPNEWIAEASPIVAIYGLGLQGWDASYSFASNQPSFFNKLTCFDINIYNSDAPHMIGLYPALARMVLRGDIKEGNIAATRKINIPSLYDGKIGFRDEVEQQHDIKSFKGIIPPQAMAVGKVVVEFTNHYDSTQAPDLSKYWNISKSEITSTTGELVWNYANKGYFACNTPKSKALVGFAANQSFDFNEFSLKTSNNFAVILITSLDDKELEVSKKILVIAMARVRNTGMQYNENSTEVLTVGSEPLLLEPVNFELNFKHKTNGTVNLLDHTGCLTKNKIAIENNTITINGSSTQTFYYEITRD